MTPLAQFFSRFLSQPWASVALWLAYVGMLGAILLFEAPLGDQIIYIDFQGGK